MRTGRPSKTTRTDFGARIRKLRETAGLSQQQVADTLGVSQPSYALWERRDVALRAKQLAKLAEVLGVSCDELIGTGKNGKQRGGPQGRARRTFEVVSKLPRHRQQKILDVVDALVKA